MPHSQPLEPPRALPSIAVSAYSAFASSLFSVSVGKPHPSSVEWINANNTPWLMSAFSVSVAENSLQISKPRFPPSGFDEHPPTRLNRFRESRRNHESYPLARLDEDVQGKMYEGPRLMLLMQPSVGSGFPPLSRNPPCNAVSLDVLGR
jgi:hypothetical protein